MSKDNTTQNLTDLNEFQGWESMASEEDFFSQTEDDASKDSTDAKDVLDQVSKDDADDSKDDKDSGDDNKTPKEEDLFSLSDDDVENPGDDSSDEDDDNEDNDTDDSDDETKVQTPNISTLNLLKEKGFIDFELEENEELTEEKAEEIIEDKFDEAIEERIKDLFNDLPDVVKQINKYALNGGDINTFFGSLAKNNNPKITKDLDMDEEANQELVTREILSQEGYDDDYIDTQVEFLKDSGKLKMFSEKKFNKWKKGAEAEQAALVKQQEENSKKQKESLRKAKQKVSTFITENEEVAGLKFTKDDKKKLPAYMNDRTIKLQNGSVISEMQKELFYEVPKNEKAFMQLAVLLRNRNEDGTFNFDSIIKNTETKVVKKVKENVRRSKTSIPTGSKNTKKGSKKRLADFFNN